MAHREREREKKKKKGALLEVAMEEKFCTTSSTVESVQVGIGTVLEKQLEELFCHFS